MSHLMVKQMISMEKLSILRILSLALCRRFPLYSYFKAPNTMYMYIFASLSLFLLNVENIPGANPCDPSPCKNQGICHAEYGREFRCQCPPGLTGKTCELGKTGQLIYSDSERIE